MAAALRFSAIHFSQAWPSFAVRRSEMITSFTCSKLRVIAAAFDSTFSRHQPPMASTGPPTCPTWVAKAACPRASGSCALASGLGTSPPLALLAGSVLSSLANWAKSAPLASRSAAAFACSWVASLISRSRTVSGTLNWSLYFSYAALASASGTAIWSASSFSTNSFSRALPASPFSVMRCERR